jgi:CheY-like chemotaxis protein
VRFRGFPSPPDHHTVRGAAVSQCKTMLRAVVLHPEPLVRRYVRTCLSPHVTVVAEAEGASDASARIAETHPDIVFADLLMKGETGFQLAHRLREEAPGSVTVLLTDAAVTALPYLNQVARASGAARVLPYAALSDAALSLAA